MIQEDGGRARDYLERWQLSTVKLGLFSDTGVGHRSQSSTLTHAAAQHLLFLRQIYMLARRVLSLRFLLSRGLRDLDLLQCIQEMLALAECS